MNADCLPARNTPGRCPPVPAFHFPSALTFDASGGAVLGDTDEIVFTGNTVRVADAYVLRINADTRSVGAVV